MTKYLKPKDIQSILGFNMKKIYSIINRPDFPKIKVGRQYIIPEDKFYAYMDTRCYKIIS